MLGFMPKATQGTQTSADLENSFVSGKSSLWNTKIEKSTTESGEIFDFKPKPKLVKKTFINSPVRRPILEKDVQQVRSPHKSRSPTYRYKFVPTLPLK